MSEAQLIFAPETEIKEKLPGTWTPTPRLYFAFAALAVLTLVVALDGTSISVALPIIAKTLDFSALRSFWLGTSFLLASTVLQPSFASLSSIFGRMSIMLLVSTSFLAGTLICGLSKTFEVFLVGRTLQGAGAGGKFGLKNDCIEY